MTRASLREYAAVQRKRYQEARRPEKHRLLDEMVAVTGMHRKAAIRLLRRRPRAGVAEKSNTGELLGPTNKYGCKYGWQQSVTSVPAPGISWRRARP